EELTEFPAYRHTKEKLEELRQTDHSGAEFWLARDIHSGLGYPVWDKFEPVIEKARQSLAANGVDASLHIAQTSKSMEVHNGGMRRGIDYFLSRAACYLIAMNGDPTKPEIAAAQAYFAIQTRRTEVQDALSEDEKRLNLRDKVRQSHKRVSEAAQDAGVRNHMQGVFHDAGVQGLYGMSLKDLKAMRGLELNEQIFDRAGPLELSANDFQMNLAADVIRKEKIRGEQLAITRNKQVAARIRNTITQIGGTLPERLPLEVPIKEIEKRVRRKDRLPPPSGSSSN
ncbi:MAG: DNA damage-inducible protein D, partial [Roseiarcus sp.]